MSSMNVSITSQKTMNIHEKRKGVFINGKERSKNRFVGCFSVG